MAHRDQQKKPRVSGSGRQGVLVHVAAPSGPPHHGAGASRESMPVTGPEPAAAAATLGAPDTELEQRNTAAAIGHGHNGAMVGVATMDAGARAMSADAGVGGVGLNGIAAGLQRTTQEFDSATIDAATTSLHSSARRSTGALSSTSGRTHAGVVAAVTTIQRAYRAWAKRKQQRFQALLTQNKLKRLKHVQRIRARFREIFCFLAFLLLLTATATLSFQDQDIFLYVAAAALHCTRATGRAKHFAWITAITRKLQGTTRHRLGRSVDEAMFLEEFDSDDAPNMYKAFKDIATVQEFYQWLEGPLFGALYTGATWDGASDNVDPGTLFGTSIVVGAPRLTQLRARPRPCTRGPLPHLQFGDRAPVCYGDSSGDFTTAGDVEDTQEFGAAEELPPFRFDGSHPFWLLNHSYPPGALTPPRGSVFSGFAGARTNWGRVYPAAGFTVALPNSDPDAARDVISQLKQARYIDLATRFVVVDMTVLNPSMNMWVGIRAFAEIPKSGAVAVSYQLTPVRLYSWAESDAPLFAVLEAALACFYAFYICQSMQQLRSRGCRSVFGVHSAFHNLNLLFYCAMWTFRLASLAQLPDANSVLVRSDRVYDFTMPIALKATSVHLASLNVFLAWFRLCSFLAYVPRFALVTGTLSRASSTVGGFAVVFCVVLFGFAEAHMLTFGSRVVGFRNLSVSTVTLLRSLVGDFEFEAMVEAQWLLGVVFFVMFVALSVVVVLNILIAIVSDAFNEEIHELATREDVRVYHEMVAYVVHLSRESSALRALLRVCGHGRQLRKLGRVLSMRPHGRTTAATTPAAASLKYQPSAVRSPRRSCDRSAGEGVDDATPRTTGRESGSGHAHVAWQGPGDTVAGNGTVVGVLPRRRRRSAGTAPLTGMDASHATRGRGGRRRRMARRGSGDTDSTGSDGGTASVVSLRSGRA